MALWSERASAQMAAQLRRSDSATRYMATLSPFTSRRNRMVGRPMMVCGVESTGVLPERNEWRQKYCGTLGNYDYRPVG